MSDITRLAYLYQGLPQDIDATTNSLQINSLKVGSSTPVELTKAMAQLMADINTGSAGGKGLPAANLATSAVTFDKISSSALGITVNSVLGTSFTPVGSLPAAVTSSCVANGVIYVVSNNQVYKLVGGVWTSTVMSGIAAPIIITFGTDVVCVSSTTSGLWGIYNGTAWTNYGSGPIVTKAQRMTVYKGVLYAKWNATGYQLIGTTWSTWTTQAPGQTMNMTSDADYLWAHDYAANPSRMYRWDGTTWTYQDATFLCDNNNTCMQAYGTGGLLISGPVSFGVGYRLEYFNGSSWSTVAVPSSTYSHMYRYGSNVYLGGPAGNLAVWNGTTLTQIGESLSSYAVTTASTDGLTLYSGGSFTGYEVSYPVPSGTLGVPDNTLNANKLMTSAVTTTKIADNNVTSAKIAYNNVTSAQIAYSAVTSNQISDSNVTTVKIADLGVTTTKIANAAVTYPKVSSSFFDGGLGPVPGSGSYALISQTGDIGGAKPSDWGDLTWGQSFVLTASANLASLSVYCGGAGSTQVKVFSDTGTTLLATSSAVNVVSMGWYNFPITASLAAGTYYFAVYATNVAQLDMRYNNDVISGQMYRISAGNVWTARATNDITFILYDATAIGIAANGVTTAKIANNAVTSAQIATSAVGSTQIADSAVTAVKLNIGTGATAANRAVLESKLAAQRVGVLNFTPSQASSDTVTTQVLTAASVDTPIGNDPSMIGIGAAAARGIFVGSVSGATDIGKVLIRVNGTDNGIDDGTGDEIYGVLSESAGVYTLSYKKAGGAAYTLSADDVSRKLDFYFIEVMDLWTFGVDRFLLPAIGGVVDATTSNSLNTKILTETSNLQASLAAEATARAGADVILDAAILAEVTARSSADGILSASITAEASARTLADIVLQGELDTTQGSMGNVIDGDGAWLGFGLTKPAGTTHYLNSALTVTAALKALDTEDFVLQTSITAEASARNTADLAIQAQLSNISSDKTFLNLTSSGAVAIGDVLALSKDVAGQVIKANATGILTCTHIVGVATEAATGAGEVIKIQVTGEIVVNKDAAFTLGERVYVHTVSGQASKTAPGTLDNVVYLLGGATATDKLYLAPHLEFVVS